MSKAAEFLAKAEQATTEASMVTDAEFRAHYLQIAEEWRRLAVMHAQQEALDGAVENRSFDPHANP